MKIQIKQVNGTNHSNFILHINGEEVAMATLTRKAGEFKQVFAWGGKEGVCDEMASCFGLGITELTMHLLECKRKWRIFGGDQAPQVC